MPPRIYFDACALSRPFDDQTQGRVRIETEAVEHLLRAVGEGIVGWVGSVILLFEIRMCPDAEHRQKLEVLCQRMQNVAQLSASAGRRARQLRDHRLRDLDALHLAVAEAARVDVLVTTDDRFLRAARALEPPSPVRVENPVVFALEVFR